MSLPYGNELSVSFLFMRVHLDVGKGFTPAHKNPDDYVLFEDLKQLYLGFQEMRHHIETSRDDLERNTGMDLVARVIMATGTLIGFALMMMFNSRQRLRGILNNLLFQQQSNRSIPLQTMQSLAQPTAPSVTPYSVY